MAHRVLILTAAVALMACSALAEPDASPTSSARESTDIYIRRLAGLPASSAKGDIEIIDVGHHPTDTMISIVATRTHGGWHVSYACAQSPGCDPGLYHAAKEYDLPEVTARNVEAILKKLEHEPEVAEAPVTPPMICGHLSVAVKDNGFWRDYRRACVWGASLGELEALLKPPKS